MSTILRSDDATFTKYSGITYAGLTAKMFRRLMFRWQQAGLDSARFPSITVVDTNKVWISYSPRNSLTNDGEQGMRLDVVEATIDTEAETVTFGTPAVIATPTLFTSGLGAIWNCGIIKLPTGRKIIVAQELNSPDGTYTNSASRYDVALYYTDGTAVSGSWTRVLISSGETAYTDFGVADVNAPAAGFHIPSGNCILRLDSGRLVIGGYLPYSGNGRIAALYTDSSTGITGWTCGTPLQYATSQSNEPAIAKTATGIAAYVRSQIGDRKVLYTSTNGSTWALSRQVTEAPIRAVNSPALLNADKTIIGGATLSGDRKGFKLFTSLNDGAVFDGEISPFETVDQIGYGALTYLGNGYYVLAYEQTSSQSSFNQKGSLSLSVFNSPYLGGNALDAVRQHDNTFYNAAEEYALYAAYVTGDGGTVGDATACLNAITAAINGNYYSDIGLAVSGRWGHKNMGALDPFLYSLNRTKNSASVLNGYITRDTSTYAYATIRIPAGASLTFTLPLRKGPRMANAICEKSTNALLSWTSGTKLHYTYLDGGYVGFDPVGWGSSFIQGSPIYGFVSGDCVSNFFDFYEETAIQCKNGVAMQSVSGFPNLVQENFSQTISIQANNGYIAEIWHLNGIGITPETVRQMSADIKARS